MEEEARYGKEVCVPRRNAPAVSMQLKLYPAEYDDRLQALRPHPVHDWTSHAADSFRNLAMTLDGRAGQSGFHRRIPYASHGIE